jgi:hypothetical protein
MLFTGKALQGIGCDDGTTTTTRRRRRSGWDFVEIDAPRNAMMTHPQLVADTLLELAQA